MNSASAGWKDLRSRTVTAPRPFSLDMRRIIKCSDGNIRILVRKWFAHRSGFYYFCRKSYAMPLNRASLIRISTIDKCLQNHYRRWTINDLIDACTDALSEFEGRSNPVSRRTFQNDLALMRSDRLGYNAPIIVRDLSTWQKFEHIEFRLVERS